MPDEVFLINDAANDVRWVTTAAGVVEYVVDNNMSDVFITKWIYSEEDDDWAGT